MATRANIQAAVDRLAARGVTEIVAVPLFVSSWSSVITSTEYLLGLRAEAPAALAVYAKMNHAQPAPTATAGSIAAGHDSHNMAADGTTPVKSPVPIRMTPALNDHPIVAEILASRARSISRKSGAEAVVIVAHGPNEEDDNRRWLADMRSLAARIGQMERFAVDFVRRHRAWPAGTARRTHLHVGGGCAHAGRPLGDVGSDHSREAVNPRTESIRVDDTCSSAPQRNGVSA
jgi:hypothetical protein